MKQKYVVGQNVYFYNAEEQKLLKAQVHSVVRHTYQGQTDVTPKTTALHYSVMCESVLFSGVEQHFLFNNREQFILKVIGN